VRCRLGRRLAVIAAVLGLAGCGAESIGTGPAAVRPRDGRSGLQLTGTIGGRQVAVSDGLPTLNTGDCDPNDGADRDVCFVSRDIDGTLFVIVFENPDLLVEDASLPVGPGDCRTPEACDAVTDVAVVEVQSGIADRQRATSGQVNLAAVEPGLRYVGTLSLVLPDGRISGEFDVIPRPEEEG
jgi:hypothetical protein